MVIAEPTNNRTAGTDTNHSTMFTLLLKLNVMCEQRWIQFKLQNSPSRVFCIWCQNIHYHLANLWNQITTKIFDIFRIITLKQQKFSQSDPVLIRAHLCHVGNSNHNHPGRIQNTEPPEVCGIWFFNSSFISEKIFAHPYPILIRKFLKFSIRYPSVSDCDIA